MAAELSSLNSTQIPANQTSTDFREDSSLISSISDNDEFGFSDLEEICSSDLKAEEEYEILHMSYLDQMKYFEKHEDPPVLKKKTSDYVKRIILRNVMKTPAGRARIGRLKRSAVLNANIGIIRRRSLFVAEFKNFDRKEPSKICELQRMSEKRFWQHVDRYLERPAEEPQLSQDVINSLARYTGLIQRLRLGSARLSSASAARKNNLSLTIQTPQADGLFPETSHLEEVMDDDEFNKLVDDFYDGPQGKDIGQEQDKVDVPVSTRIT